MRKLSIAAAVVALSAGAANGASPGASDEDCEVVHIAADGGRTVTPPANPRPTSPAARGPASASASAHSAGSRSASATVSASARSGQGGQGASIASSTTRDGDRTITKTRTQDGCTIVIDERPMKGDFP